MNSKSSAFLGLVAFSVAGAYYVSSRLSADALNMLVGVLCGIAVTIPVTIGLLVALLRRQRDDAEYEPSSHRFEDPHPTQYGSMHGNQPQIIVIAPPQSQFGPGGTAYGYQYGGTPYPNYAPPMNEDVVEGRDWRIIGDDEG